MQRGAYNGDDGSGMREVVVVMDEVHRVRKEGLSMTQAYRCLRIGLCGIHAAVAHFRTVSGMHKASRLILDA